MRWLQGLWKDIRLVFAMLRPDEKSYAQQKQEWEARQDRLFKMQIETGWIFEKDCLAELERKAL